MKWNTKIVLMLILQRILIMRDGESRIRLHNFLQLPLFYNYRFSKKVRLFSGICINNGFRSRQPFANGHSYLPFSRLYILRIECHDIQSFSGGDIQRTLVVKGLRNNRKG